MIVFHNTQTITQNKQRKECSKLSANCLKVGVNMRVTRGWACCGRKSTHNLFWHDLKQIKAMLSFSFLFYHCYANLTLQDVSLFCLLKAPLSDTQSGNFVCSFCSKSQISVSNNLKTNSRSRLISLWLFYFFSPPLFDLKAKTLGAECGRGRQSSLWPRHQKNTPTWRAGMVGGA